MLSDILVCVGRMTQKCDVYSFGVVLLELLTGQEPVNKNADRPVGSTMLVDEFAPFLEQWKLEELKVWDFLYSCLCET